MARDRFAFMPENTLLSSKFKKLLPHSRLLFLYLAVKRKGVDEKFPYSYKEIRKDSRMGYETISKCIKELSREGFIEYEHGGLEVNSNIYYIYPEYLQI